MKFIIVAILAYFLISIQVILDKFLLSSRKVSHPSVYAFYTGALSLFTVALAPFGVRWTENSFFGIASGAVFLYGILLLFFAIRKSEASRVLPIIGAVTPLVTYGMSFIAVPGQLEGYQLLGVAGLIGGGLLISLRLPFALHDRKLFAGFWYSVCAGAMLAIAAIMFKNLYDAEGEFLNMFVWSRMGLALGALTLLLISRWRKIIFRSFHSVKKRNKEDARTGLIFVLNKLLGGAGSVLYNYAISLGDVTIISALVSIEYVFVLAFGLGLSFKFPGIFHERHHGREVFQKTAAIVLISLGIFLVSITPE